jgi:hypothetical protein
VGGKFVGEKGVGLKRGGGGGGEVGDIMLSSFTNIMQMYVCE